MKVKATLGELNIDVALYYPEIPSNTGNIGRLCVGTGSRLHIIGRPSFLMRDKEVKRAGLDYWELLNIVEHKNEYYFIEYAKNEKRRVVPVSKYGKTLYCEYEYNENDIFLFGRETSGLSEKLMNEYRNDSVYIQMTENIRSINLSNSVSIVLYEAWRKFIF